MELVATTAAPVAPAPEAGREGAARMSAAAGCGSPACFSLLADAAVSNGNADRSRIWGYPQYGWKVQIYIENRELRRIKLYRHFSVH